MRMAWRHYSPHCGRHIPSILTLAGAVDIPRAILCGRSHDAAALILRPVSPTATASSGIQLEARPLRSASLVRARGRPARCGGAPVSPTLSSPGPRPARRSSRARRARTRPARQSPRSPSRRPTRHPPGAAAAAGHTRPQIPRPSCPPHWRPRLCGARGRRARQAASVYTNARASTVPPVCRSCLHALAALSWTARSCPAPRHRSRHLRSAAPRCEQVEACKRPPLRLPTHARPARM